MTKITGFNEAWAIVCKFFERSDDHMPKVEIILSEATKKEDAFRRALAYREEGDAPQLSCPPE